MNPLQGVYWHQGMFMQPQHFQLADLSQQLQLRPVVSSGLPFFWGLGSIDIEPVAAGSRAITVRQATLMLPDGSYIEYPGNAVLAARNFDLAWLASGTPLTVYLGVKQMNWQEPNVSLVDAEAQASAAATRYATLSQPENVPDLHSAGPAAPIRGLSYVLKLFFAHELPQLGDFQLVPVAQLRRTDEGVERVRDYIPPCYRLDAEDTLRYLLKDLRDEVAARARQLQEYKSPRELQRSEYDPNEMVLLLALRSLNRSAPLLYHMAEAGQTHPWHVYGALRQLVGELSSFSEGIDLLGADSEGSAGVPPYDHNDLYGCFATVRSLITRLLNELTIGPEFMVSLTWRDGSYRGDLPSTFFDRRNRFYLVARSSDALADLAHALQSQARLAAPDDLAGLVQHALPGLELIHMANAPQGMPRRIGSSYFRIEQISELWDSVEQQGEIALLWPEAPAELKLEVIVLRR